ncbi:3-keto-5-aminohexanoate cleavage protein [Nocardia sp. NPDC004068]|uniref:3-keto-5-aminohexanoate cleavage protein n=1 Tax=Nocardia sp. NPDC004068 TaxID=3364303 RepID=UPI0036A0F310
MTLQACINGQRHPHEARALPATLGELVDEAAAAVRAGADNVHVHPKDADGHDTLGAEEIETLVHALRARISVPLGVTTGDWIHPDPRHRAAAVDAWTTLPDFASVNWHETGADRIAAALLSRGCGVEAGLFDLDAARAWARSPHAGKCLRAMIELPGALPPADIADYAARMRRIIGDSHPHVPILLHGIDENCWAAVDYAGAHGYQARVGLEDTLVLRGGELARGNADLVDSVVTAGKSEEQGVD